MSSRLSAKCRYTAGGVTPTARAIARIETASSPRSAISAIAASRISRRRRSPSPRRAGVLRVDSLTVIPNHSLTHGKRVL